MKYSQYSKSPYVHDFMHIQWHVSMNALTDHAQVKLEIILQILNINFNITSCSYHWPSPGLAIMDGPMPLDIFI